jgi:hypothetical protein
MLLVIWYLGRGTQRVFKDITSILQSDGQFAIKRISLERWNTAILGISCLQPPSFSTCESLPPESQSSLIPNQRSSDGGNFIHGHGNWFKARQVTQTNRKYTIVTCHWVIWEIGMLCVFPWSLNSADVSLKLTLAIVPPVREGCLRREPIRQKVSEEVVSAHRNSRQEQGTSMSHTFSLELEPISVGGSVIWNFNLERPLHSANWAGWLYSFSNLKRGHNYLVQPPAPPTPASPQPVNHPANACQFILF